MTENKNYTNTPIEEDDHEIDLMEYVRKLWNARMTLLKVAGIAAVVGIVIGFSIPKQYTAEVILSPESSKTGNNRLSSMASMLSASFSISLEYNCAVSIMLPPKILTKRQEMTIILTRQTKS